MVRDERMKVLQHHGILGQKWGDRNGPPYPLGSGDHSSSEKKAGYKKSLGAKSKDSNWYKKNQEKQNESNTESSDERKEKKGLTDEQKKKLYIAVGATAAAVALTAIGIYAVKSGKIQALTKKGIEKFPDIDKSETINGLNRLTYKETDRQRLKNCNPEITYEQKIGLIHGPYITNCGNTVIANEMRNRGYDVSARGNLEGMTLTQMGQYFDGLKSESFVEPKINVPKLSKTVTDEIEKYGMPISPKAIREIRIRAKEVQKQLEQSLLDGYPDGARGCLLVSSEMSAHWLSFERKGDKVIIENPQIPGLNLTSFFGQFRDQVDIGQNKPYNFPPTAIRLDDTKPTNLVTEVVKNTGDKLADANIADKVETDIFGKPRYIKNGKKVKGTGQDFNVDVQRGNNFVMKYSDSKRIYP